MTGVWIVPFIVLAAVGLVLSILTTVLTLAGLPSPLGEATSALHVGIFIVWLPAVIVATRLVKDFKQKDFWKAALRGCPIWMRYATYGFFAYAFIAFFLFNFVMRDGNASPNPKGFGLEGNALMGFSGHWMAFYSAAASILFSAWKAGQRDLARRCPSGHPVDASAQFCPECGKAVSMR